jgi:hypothetical protein
MDSFDDLFVPSGHSLEDNPFADPFAKQRSSPDPWATPFEATDSYHAFEDHHPAFEDSHHAFESTSQQESSSLPPLEDNPSTGVERSIIGLSLDPHHDVFDNTSQQESSFLSPLENNPSTGAERPIIGLSLGGETLGWQAEAHTAWQPEHEHPISLPTKLAPQSDEDSDDDKPVMQTLKHHDQDESVSVSVHTRLQCVPFNQCSFVFEKTSQKAIRNDKGIQPVFMITVDDPQKVGDPIRSFTMYTVHTRVSLFSSSFKWLIHSN